MREEVVLSQWACNVPALISSVSDRAPSALREMERLGIRPGVAVIVEAWVRNSALAVRIGGQEKGGAAESRLAGEISVVPAEENAGSTTTIGHSAEHLPD